VFSSWFDEFGRGVVAQDVVVFLFEKTLNKIVGDVFGRAGRAGGGLVKEYATE